MLNCKLCNAPIKFSKQYVSERSGRMIPLDPSTGMPHDCPVWNEQKAYTPQSREQPQRSIRYYSCRNGCGSMIYFNEQQKTDTGKWIPIEKDTDEPHDCPNR
jgi:hypothetical protein